jgi:pyruvyltransferase
MQRLHLPNSIRSRSLQLVDAFQDYRFFSRNNNLLPCSFYSSTANVGDQLNLDILKHLSQKDPVEVKSPLTPHIIAIGSIAHLAGRGSHLWGCGIVSRHTLPIWRRLSKSRVHALRGQYTLNEFRKRGIDINTIPLGDPAILSSLYFRTKSEKTKYRYGIIPHYRHYCMFQSSINLHTDLKILDVSKKPLQFIDDLLSCQYILSSSLHGLILADTFELPNKWIKINPELFGGDFKFHDYYSTTDFPDEMPEPYDPTTPALKFCSLMLGKYSVKRFVLSKQALIESFPSSL